jgi:hypothetical protein
MLPGLDPLFLYKVFFIPIHLGLAVVSLGLAMATAAFNTQMGQLWHRPGPSSSGP